HHIQRAANRARVLHHEGDALALDGLVLLVNEPVLPGHPQRRLDVHARERIERVVHHLGDYAAEMLDLAVLVGRTLHRRESGCDIADLLALIANALEVRDRLDDRDDHPQVAGGRGARGQGAAALLVDGNFHVVDLVVVHRDGLPEGAVALHERRNGLVELLLDEPAHAEHFAADALETFFVTSRDTVTEIRG